MESFIPKYSPYNTHSGAILEYMHVSRSSITVMRQHYTSNSRHKRQHLSNWKGMQMSRLPTAGHMLSSCTPFNALVNTLNRQKSGLLLLFIIVFAIYALHYPTFKSLLWNVNVYTVACSCHEATESYNKYNNIV